MKHPEQQDDEAFIMNVRRDDSLRVNWLTKRFGDRAYSRDGSEMPGLRPIFVKHREILRQPTGARFAEILKKDGYW